ncbi:MAG: PilZ domain-containing protein [Gammaproteobacteria bacterium]|nr:PilZ domain-containing protein [Gammaproteobacteria bacterium]
MIETPTKAAHNRSQERVSVALPVHLETGGGGRTWNISASGVYFETDAELVQGSPINLEVELNSPGGKLALKVQGSVVRIEQLDGKIGVAVSIAESVLEPVPENAP